MEFELHQTICYTSLSRTLCTYCYSLTTPPLCGSWWVWMGTFQENWRRRRQLETRKNRMHVIPKGYRDVCVCSTVSSYWRQVQRRTHEVQFP
jgi:hypothetical protein